MKVLIISGGSRGLGRSLVEIYKENGWEVFDISRNGTYRCDFSKPESVERTLMSIDIPTRIDELVIISNSAVIDPLDMVENLDTKKVIDSININASSGVLFITHFIKLFRNLDSRKTVINISSGAALHGYEGWSIYCGVKALTENFINSLILEENHYSKKFTAFNYDPGVMDTGMQETIRSKSSKNFPNIDRFKDFKADGNLANPRDVAQDLYTLYTTDSIIKERYKYPSS